MRRSPAVWRGNRRSRRAASRTSSGRVVVSADDIFKEQELTGLDADDTKVISLSALITQADPGVDNFEVQFRVWDKKGAGEVRGKYYFSLKKD